MRKKLLKLLIVIGAFIFGSTTKAYADDSKPEDLSKYYHSQMIEVINDVNQKHFHPAFIKIHRMTDEIREHHHEQYLYVPNMCLGFFYTGRNQPEMGEIYFRKALQTVDRKKNDVAVFNCYLSLAQVMSFNKPAEAMACLDSLPQHMLQNPMYDSGVLGFRCILASKMGDNKAFKHYFARYDSIRQNLPQQFNSANLFQVMVCHALMNKDYKLALAWSDSTDVELMATELRRDIYDQMGDWKKAYEAAELKDSLQQLDEREVLEELLMDASRDINLLQAEQDKAELRKKQLLTVGLMSLIIIALLIAILIYRYFKNHRLKEQFLQLQEARRKTEAGQAIRRAFVTTILEKLKSPINVLMNYSRIFNDPQFNLKPEERIKRYSDIVAAARNIESMMDPVLNSYAQGTISISEEERRTCMDAIRSPLLSLIGTAEMIIEANGQIPHEEYQVLRSEVCRDAYNVATSTHKLVLYSLYGDGAPLLKNVDLHLNESLRSILNSYDLQHTGPDLNAEKERKLTLEYKTDISDDVIIRINPLFEVIINCLLSNVNKYATGGTVLLNCHKEPNGTYTVSLSNEGPTISDADAERIFEPYVRLNANEHSLGIGLALARSLATSMGYTLYLDTTFTQGARFVIALNAE